MKSRFSLLSLLLGLGFAGPFGLLAQNPPEAPASPPAPAGAEITPLPESADSPEAPDGPDAVEAPPVPREGELRELGTDLPSSILADPAPPVEADDTSTVVPTTLPTVQPVRRNDGSEIIAIGSPAHLPKGRTARTVVSILNNATAEGEVTGPVIAVIGNSHAKENVGEAVVAVLGNATAEKNVGDVVVAVVGNARLDGRAREVVAVLGDVELGPNAVVEGQVVAVGGVVRRHPTTEIHGNVNEIPFMETFPMLKTLGLWFRETILKARLLAFHPELLWPWMVAIAFLLFYALLALACGPAINRCAETLEQRPGRTLLAAFFSMIAAPPLLLLLSFTVIGAFAFFVLMLVALLFGKAAFLAFLGRRITKPLGMHHAAVAVLFGGAIVTLLYAVPVLGLVLWKLGTMIGLGMVVYTLVLTSRRDRPTLVAGVPMSAGVIAPGTGIPGSEAGIPVVASAATTATLDPATTVPGPAPLPPPFVPPVLPVTSYATLPRAGFWIRLAAALIDVVLVGAIAQFLAGGDLFLLLLTAYCITMWSLKGTTIGGIICSLKVVRLDDRKLDWTVALVRSLSSFLSFAVAGIGFIWVAFDPQKQSWHDKIAGTTIVQMPRGVSLV